MTETSRIDESVFGVAKPAAIPREGGWMSGCLLVLVAALAIAALPGALPAQSVFEPEFDSQVRSIVVQPDGKILVGGSFNTVDSVAISGIARLNADGTLDTTFDPGAGVSGANARVNALLLQPDGKVVVGGFFDTVAGAARAGLARLNADGSIDSGFVYAAQAGVYCMALQPDGKVLIGGAIGGTPFKGAQRVNADGSIDSSFSSLLTMHSPVEAIALHPNGEIIIGGEFDFVGAVAQKYIARLTADGTVDGTFAPLLDNSAGVTAVRALAARADGKVLVAGEFTSVNGAEKYHLARLNANGSLDADFSGGVGFATDRAECLAVQPDGKLLVGGMFLFAGSTGVFVPRGSIARFSDAGAVDSTFRTGDGASGTVVAMALQSDGKVLIGGSFSLVNNQPRSNLARLEPAGQLEGYPPAKEDIDLKNAFKGSSGGSGGCQTAAVLWPPITLLGLALIAIHLSCWRNRRLCSSSS